MSVYILAWKRAALKEVAKLPREVAHRVVAAVEGLVTDPHPPGSRKLVGAAHTYRLRVGDYRVIYHVASAALVVEVVRVAHRREAYDR